MENSAVIEQEAAHYLSSRPLTPPYVPFGIRRFSNLCAVHYNG